MFAAKAHPSPCSVPVTSPALAGMNPTNITCPSLPKCFLINLQPFFYLYLLNSDTHLSIQDDFHPSSATKNSCKNIHSTSSARASIHAPPVLQASLPPVTSLQTHGVCACIHAYTHAHTHVSFTLTAQKSSKINKHSQPASPWHLPAHCLAPSPAPRMKPRPCRALRNSTLQGISTCIVTWLAALSTPSPHPLQETETALSSLPNTQNYPSPLSFCALFTKPQVHFKSASLWPPRSINISRN